MLAKTLHDLHYRSPEKLAHAIADVLAAQVRHLDADVIQVDEANLPGHPDEWKWAAETINKVLKAVPKTAKAAVHLCFGNYGGQSIQKGGWDQLLDYLNALKVDHIVMEVRAPAARGTGRIQGPAAGDRLRPGRGGHQAHRDRDPERDRARDRKSGKDLGRNKIKYVHPDCGFWMLKRNIADGKIRALVKGRDLYEGRSG